MSEAQKSSAAAKEALLEAKETAKEAEKMSREADLERSAESAAEQAPQRPPTSLENQTAEFHLTHAADRLEISEQGREAAVAETVLSTEKPANPSAEAAIKETSHVPAQAPQKHKPSGSPNPDGKPRAILKTKTRFSFRA